MGGELSKGEELPEGDPITPDITLGGELHVSKALRGIPVCVWVILELITYTHYYKVFRNQEKMLYMYRHR